ncbi:hypothetical protein C5167_048541 [Papaver somniferum]|uniref:Uncharacterized protein n=1 Tax=Papaver somniferum TaxID=3469 RepID=A0A4Y7KL52_PAPSO|nr:hypothetical protein C5167_048541 [Papaver somniferum]
MNLDKLQCGSEDLLLWELQFSYIAFLLGSHLHRIILTHHSTEKVSFFTKFIEVSVSKDDKIVSGGEKGASLFLDDSWPL